MSKQTAVQYLIEQIESSKTLYDDNGYSNADELKRVIDQALAMEREQSANDYIKGQESMSFKFPLSAEQYYNETYKGGNDE